MKISKETVACVPSWQDYIMRNEARQMFKMTDVHILVYLSHTFYHHPNLSGFFQFQETARLDMGENRS